jgi:hypothetical protein
MTHRFAAFHTFSANGCGDGDPTAEVSDTTKAEQHEKARAIKKLKTAREQV